jgi:ribonuclease P protein component
LRFTFPQTFLFKKADFSTLFKIGRKKHGSFFIVYYYIPEQTDFKRFGLVVGKKATGNNVKRNLVKRVIREAYRLKQHHLGSKQLLILAKRDLKTVCAQDLRQDLDEVLTKIYD